MTIVDRLNEDLKQAMKEKEKDKLSVIRMVKSSLKYEEINLGRTLSEEDVLAVMSRELKQRRDSLREFEKAGRQDLIDGIQKEISILQKYLPEQMGEDEIRKLVEEAIASTGATSRKEMGKVMSYLMPKVKGRADGGLVNQIVQQYLA